MTQSHFCLGNVSPSVTEAVHEEALPTLSEVANKQEVYATVEDGNLTLYATFLAKNGQPTLRST